MDWASEEGRALLRKAWPDGYLAKRGVRTVGGFEVCEGSVERGLRFVPSGRASLAARAVMGALGISQAALGRSAFAHVAESGVLLPLPDPEDTATWACLLQDLWEAVASKNEWTRRPRGVAFMRAPALGEEMSRWAVAGFFDGSRSSGASWGLVGTADPAEALVTIRALLRAEGT